MYDYDVICLRVLPLQVLHSRTLSQSVIQHLEIKSLHIQQTAEVNNTFDATVSS